MQHSEVIARVARWLRNTKKLPVVLLEIGTDGLECPDVIGWDQHGASWVVECKVSRSDFLADRKKPFRQCAELGMGELRWFATPPGLVKTSDLPEGWGLVEVRKKTMRVLRAPDRREIPVSVHRREKRLLSSAVRRGLEGWGRQVFGEVSLPEGDGDSAPEGHSRAE